ncbi:acetyl-CoA C-acetyltransferase [Paenibacillus silvisoli]|uniref:acetyl-CoA C-acetyltransferase n=1 Tax=Paenibacillus silvisoli TaxID=3110539 RepID=UPI002803B441|nr:acetyl-CoA C-acetyltransferase [Paenibacillus silvisoli]
MAELVILGGARTPFGKFGGALKGMRAVQLGGIAIEGALQRSGVSPQSVDEAIMGMAVQAGAGQNPARQAAILAGIGNGVPAETINKVCASGMRALTMASQIIAAGDAELMIAGGMESMSQAPHALGDARFGLRLGDGRAKDLLLRDGLTCAFAPDTHMGDYADSIAAKHGISRQEQDEWALRSHERAVQSGMKGYFDAELIPVPLQGAASVQSHVFAFDKDEAPRGDTSAEKLAALKPVFAGIGTGGGRGTITAGNAPGLNDGAAALVVASKAKALREGYPPRAVLLGHAAVSVEPRNYAIAPAFAVQKLLRQQGIDMAAVDLFEINEAFAVVVLACGKLAGWDAEKVNVHGGAIAIGHPVGASGARIVLTLINGLKQRGGGLGVAAICSGGGQGDAVLVRVE